MNSDEHDSWRRNSVRTAWVLGLSLALAGAVMPLVPATFRPMNFAVFGAVGLFLAVRGGRFAPLVSLLGVAAGKLGADLVNYFWVYAGSADYLPMPSVYLALLAYPLIGWAFTRRFANPFGIAAGSLLGSVSFFLITNFFSWREPLFAYPQTLEGLVQTYTLGLPFLGKTLLSDLGFTLGLFAAHAVLVRVRSAKAISLEVRS